MLSRHSPLLAKPVQNPRSALPPEDIVHCFTRRVLGLWGAGPREFPALSTASPARVRGCWAGADFSGLTFSWSSSGTPTAATLAPNPPRGPQARCAELPNITAPGGAAGSARRQAACTESRTPAEEHSSVPARRSPSQPAVCSEPCRTEELKGGGKNCRAWRDKDAPKWKASSPPELRLFPQFKYPTTIEMDQ